MTEGTSGQVPTPSPGYDAEAVSRARASLLELLSKRDDTMGGVPVDYITPEQGIVGAADRYQQEVDSARSELDKALTERREVALDLGSPSKRSEVAGDTGPHPGNIKARTDRMTSAEYAALDPLKRAAVDFNQSLVAAVRRDRKMQDTYAPSADQRATYDLSVEKLFGPDGGSDWYAPETLALLQQLELKDPQGGLDAFLNLEAAVTAKDLKGLSEYQLPNAIRGEGPEQDRADMVHQVASSTQDLEAKLAKGQQMLQTWAATMSAERAQTVDHLGGVMHAPKSFTGYGAGQDQAGNTTLDGYFQMAFERLARKGADVPGIMAQLADGAKPGEMDAFMKYLDQRSQNSEQYGLELGVEKGTTYLTPEQFREILGLNGGSHG